MIIGGLDAIADRIRLVSGKMTWDHCELRMFGARGA
jgi:hypothetical protein